jgi:DNA polymerase (family X)
MKNLEVAELLRKIAQLLEIKGDLIFKIRAYENAADAIENLDKDVEDIWKNNRLNTIPGIGKALNEKISEFLEKGKSEYYDELKKQLPVNLDELGRIQGIGPKTIMKMYKELGVKNLKDLEKAANSCKIEKIAGLGKTVQENIVKSIAFAKSTGSRVSLRMALDIAEKIKEKLSKFPYVQKIDISGSLRRRKETIGDVDIIVASKNPDKVKEYFANIDNVEQVLAQGPTKSSIRAEGMQIDLRVIPEKMYGAALLYFTGSQQHNIALRRIALKKGLKLSEYGIFNKKTNQILAGKTEEECYKKLGLNYINPELRENEGEIEASLKNKLPKLIQYGDLKGDLQMHTNYSDGNNTIFEMAHAAKKLGHEYICITDHVGETFKIANSMNEKQIKKQKKEIDKVNKKLKNITILQGGEVNIKSDGSMDIKNSVLKSLDIVLASIHSGFKNDKDKITKRIITAMENEHVDIIAHPSARLINQRPAVEWDFDKILEKAKQTNTILEINASPERLDLRDKNVRAAISKRIKLSIGTDSHETSNLKNFKLGLAVARRGWASKKDIINTRSVKQMLNLLK